MQLSEKDLRLVQCCLRFAAGEYEKFAALETNEERSVLRDCFTAQAKEANALLARITDEIG